MFETQTIVSIGKVLVYYKDHILISQKNVKLVHHYLSNPFNMLISQAKEKNAPSLNNNNFAQYERQKLSWLQHDKFGRHCKQS